MESLHIFLGLGIANHDINTPVFHQSTGLLIVLQAFKEKKKKAHTHTPKNSLFFSHEVETLKVTKQRKEKQDFHLRFCE